jgi:hypothetical protein
MGAAVAAIPLASALVDRYPRQRVLLAIHLARGSALAVCALVLAMGGVLPLVFVLAGMIAFCGWPSSTVARHPSPRSRGSGLCCSSCRATSSSSSSTVRTPSPGSSWT